LPRNAQKRTKKKREKKRRHVRTFFCELAQMYVVFSFYFPATPWASADVALMYYSGLRGLCPRGMNKGGLARWGAWGVGGRQTADGRVGCWRTRGARGERMTQRTNQAGNMLTPPQARWCGSVGRTDLASSRANQNRSSGLLPAEAGEHMDSILVLYLGLLHYDFVRYIVHQYTWYVTCRNCGAAIAQYNVHTSACIGVESLLDDA
jgi:hypothetical protein